MYLILLPSRPLFLCPFSVGFITKKCHQGNGQLHYDTKHVRRQRPCEPMRRPGKTWSTLNMNISFNKGGRCFFLLGYRSMFFHCWGGRCFIFWVFWGVFVCCTTEAHWDSGWLRFPMARGDGLLSQGPKWGWCHEIIHSSRLWLLIYPPSRWWCSHFPFSSFGGMSVLTV